MRMDEPGTKEPQDGWPRYEVFEPRWRDEADLRKELLRRNLSAEGDKPELIERLEQAGPNLEGSPEGLMHYAIQADDLELLDLALKRGASPRVIFKLSTWPQEIDPLGMAIRQGREGAVRALLAAGAPRRGAELPAALKQPAPLAAAAEGGRVALVRALLAAGAPPDDRAREGDPTPLWRAADAGRAAAAAALLEAGASPDARDARTLRTPLHRAAGAAAAAAAGNAAAAAGGAAAAAAALLAGGADWRARDLLGETPLDKCRGAEGGEAAEVRRLLEAAAAAADGEERVPSKELLQKDGAAEKVSSMKQEKTPANNQESQDVPQKDHEKDAAAAPAVTAAEQLELAQMLSSAAAGGDLGDAVGTAPSLSSLDGGGGGAFPLPGPSDAGDGSLAPPASAGEVDTRTDSSSTPLNSSPKIRKHSDGGVEESKASGVPIAEHSSSEEEMDGEPIKPALKSLEDPPSMTKAEESTKAEPDQCEAEAAIEPANQSAAETRAQEGEGGGGAGGTGSGPAAAAAAAAPALPPASAAAVVAAAAAVAVAAAEAPPEEREKGGAEGGDEGGDEGGGKRGRGRPPKAGPGAGAGAGRRAAPPTQGGGGGGDAPPRRGRGRPPRRRSPSPQPRRPADSLEIVFSSDEGPSSDDEGGGGGEGKSAVPAAAAAAAAAPEPEPLEEGAKKRGRGRPRKEAGGGGGGGGGGGKEEGKKGPPAKRGRPRLSAAAAAAASEGDGEGGRKGGSAAASEGEEGGGDEKGGGGDEEEAGGGGGGGGGRRAAAMGQLRAQRAPQRRSAPAPEDMALVGKRYEDEESHRLYVVAEVCWDASGKGGGRPVAYRAPADAAPPDDGDDEPFCLRYTRDRVEAYEKFLLKSKKKATGNRQSSMQQSPEWTETQKGGKSRKRGRPSKKHNNEPQEASNQLSPKKKRGRPKKVLTSPAHASEDTNRTDSEVPAVKSAKKKRGRPKKKISISTDHALAMALAMGDVLDQTRPGVETPRRSRRQGKAGEAESFVPVVGMRIEAYWDGEDTWYPGKITRKNSDGTFRVLYNDGSIEEREKLKDLRPDFDAMADVDDDAPSSGAGRAGDETESDGGGGGGGGDGDGDGPSPQSKEGGGGGEEGGAAAAAAAAKKLGAHQDKNRGYRPRPSVSARSLVGKFYRDDETRRLYQVVDVVFDAAFDAVVALREPRDGRPPDKGDDEPFDLPYTKARIAEYEAKGGRKTTTGMVAENVSVSLKKNDGDNNKIPDTYAVDSSLKPVAGGVSSKGSSNEVKRQDRGLATIRRKDDSDGIDDDVHNSGMQRDTNSKEDERGSSTNEGKKKKESTTIEDDDEEEEACL